MKTRALALVLALVGAAGAYGIPAGTPKPASADREAEPADPRGFEAEAGERPGLGEDPLERGRALYLDHCARCHGIDAAGDGPDARDFDVPAADLRAPDLHRLHSDRELVDAIRDGTTFLLRPRRVPVPPGTPETDAMVRFLAALPSMRTDVVAAGRRLWIERCRSCHGWYGRPERSPGPPALSDPEWQRSLSDDELRAAVRHAREGMRPLDPPVGEAEGAELAAFVRVLSPGYETYQRFCASCHGPRGLGETPRAVPLRFDEEFLRSMPRDELRERVWHMLRGAKPSMPHFAGRLTAEEAESIVLYLRGRVPGGAGERRGGPMRLTSVRATIGAALVLGATLATGDGSGAWRDGSAAAEERPRAAPPGRSAPVAFDYAAYGRELFGTYCAACHGADARGGGPAAKALAKPPGDLTRLAERSGGGFPRAAVEEIVDGRQAFAAHGSREMPVWGDVFTRDKGAHAAAVRVFAVTNFLESIQAK